MKKVLYKIYSKLKLMFIQKLIDFSSNKDIGIDEIILAEYIYLNDGITIKEIVKKFKLSPSNINYKLEVLLKNNIIIKVQSKEDKRKVLLYASEEYKKMNLREERYVDSLNARIKLKFSENDYINLNKNIIEIDDEIIKKS